MHPFLLSIIWTTPTTRKGTLVRNNTPLSLESKKSNPLFRIGILTRKNRFFFGFFFVCIYSFELLSSKRNQVMGETVEDAVAASKAKPTISVPPRGSMEALYVNWSGSGFSPGPMTLMSSFVSEQGSFSFSQLLAGAMASPVVAKQESLLRSDSELKERERSFSNDGKNSGRDSRYKQNRPMDLVVAQPQLQLEPQGLSPLFMFPPGLSPSGLLNSPGFLSPLQNPFGMSHQQALAHVTAQAAFSQSYTQMQGFRRSLSAATSEPLAHHSVSAPSKTLTDQTSILPGVPERSKIDTSEFFQSDGKAVCVASDKPVSDGYNWRKYGQKHVKASECPRSYYKCTHLYCPVKKTVERSLDGHISEITYKGQHNHDQPQPSKRGKDSCALDRTMNSQLKPVIASQSQTEKKGLGEAIAVNSESLNFQATTQQPFEHHHVTTHNVEMKDTTMDGVDRNDEPIVKRRITDIDSSMPVSSQQAVTDAKIVVQTRSEVDLWDDGFKWRKYGQKLVKGNPHPRSYYRCTYSGCDVRKHVERASADPKAVITTYEGKHNHEFPVERCTSHGSASASTSAQQLKT